MYHPYFRGKQNELITIRENAELISESEFIPIIEPVKESLNGLQRAIKALIDVDGEVIVVVNPQHGYFRNDGESVSLLVEEEYLGNDLVSVGVLLTTRTSIAQVLEICERHGDNAITFIHAGFSAGRELAEQLGDDHEGCKHIFIENNCSKLYRRHFESPSRVLVRDGFVRRKNRDYPAVEFFSDLHITFDEEGVNGFGDFLIVGDDYSDSGGPAYAIAIHLTCIDEENDEEMHIHHFVSDRQDSPADPAGKFLEALNKLIFVADSDGNNFFETKALVEFRSLHERGHFPGLGYLKKLSMQHHIETLAIYFDQ